MKEASTLVIGFTGSRQGMTSEQQIDVTRPVHAIESQAKGESRSVRAVHGDCIGSDKQFDEVCKVLVVPCGIRPCTLENMRAWCDSEVLADPEPPMKRNRAIVSDADVLIATPPNYERIKRGSGTWATIGFGERAGIRVIVVFPDGSLRVT